MLLSRSFTLLRLSAVHYSVVFTCIALKFMLLSRSYTLLRLSAVYYSVVFTSIALKLLDESLDIPYTLITLSVYFSSLISQIFANESKYLNAQWTADDLIDNSVKFFEDWKLKKYRKMKKDRLLQRLLDEIESQGVDDILAEVNAEEGDIVLSEDDDEDDEERRLPPVAAGDVIVHVKCCVCLSDGEGTDLNFFSFDCGHEFCDGCSTRFFSVNPSPQCAVCRLPLTGKRRMYRNNDFVVRASQNPTVPVPRVLTQEERRQENVLFMRSLPANPEATVAAAEVDTDNDVESDNGDIFASAGNILFIIFVISHSFLICF